MGLTGTVRAQQDQPDDNGDDPSRGVARISVIQGEVNVKRGDSGELVAAALNAPLLAQDHLQTAGGSRAEIQFDSANMVRLAPDTDLNLAEVRDRHYQLQLATGTILYRVLRDSQANAEIDTPSVSVRPTGRGAFRITVAGDGTTEVTARSGELEIDSPSGSQTLHAGQTMLARGSSSDPEFQVEGEISRDQFDDWSSRRDQDLLRSRSYQYVSTDIYGADDLDAYGSWVSSSYGNVWAPRVAPGWAPYHDGRWVWEDYYGWTWVDYSPWGWAPFHYGRWFQNGRAGWCWWPGAPRQRYYWRPAVVGFFGFGGGVGVSVGFGFGNVGWVPLAPYEAWHPWYGRGWGNHGGWGGGGYNRTIVNNTIINNVNVYNTYRNARVSNAVAYSNINNFGRGGHGIYSARGEQIRNASLVRGQLPITPQRSSLAFSNRGPAAVSQRFTRAENQHFFTRQNPGTTQRIPFTQQQRSMADVQQRTLGVRPATGGGMSVRQDVPAANQGFRRLNDSNGANSNSTRQVTGQNDRGIRAAGQGNSGPTRNGGWQRFGQRAPSNSGVTNGRPPNQNGNSAQRQATGNESGWRRFGDPGAGSAPRQSQRPAQSAGQENGWHQFGAPVDAAPRQNQNWNRGAGAQSTRPQQYQEATPRYRAEQPVRINPPIVRDRPSAAPRMSDRISEPRNIAPRMSEPRMSEPRYAAPRISEPRNAAPAGGRQSMGGSGRAVSGGGARSGGGGRGGDGGGGGHAGGGRQR
jgi:hypothetical protein